MHNNPAAETKRHLASLESCLSQYDFSDSFCFLDRSQESGLSSQTIGAMRQRILKIIEVALFQDGDVSLGIRLARAAGEIELIREKIRQLRSSDQPNLGYYDLPLAIGQFGTQADIENLIRNYTSDTRFIADTLGRPEYDNPIKAFRLGISMNLHRYAKHYNVPLGRVGEASTVNAAVELHKRNYDLVVGVLNAGTIFALPLEALGSNVRYLEYHRSWKRKKPVWRKVGRHQEKPKKAKRILICENDSVTGKTLRAVLPKVEALEPELIDVCFDSEDEAAFQKSLEAARHLPLNEIIDADSLGYDNLYGNLRGFSEKLRQPDEWNTNNDNDRA